MTINLKSECATLNFTLEKELVNLQQNAKTTPRIPPSK